MEFLFFCLAFFILIGWICWLSSKGDTEQRDRIVELTKLMTKSYQAPEPLWRISIPITKRCKKVRKKKPINITKGMELDRTYSDNLEKLIKEQVQEGKDENH